VAQGLNNGFSGVKEPVGAIVDPGYDVVASTKKNDYSQYAAQDKSVALFSHYSSLLRFRHRNFMK
jgi:hypothetical protein